MAIPRRQVVDPDIPAIYHALSRCVRRAFLFRRPCGGDRRRWVAEQLAKVLECFAFDLHAFAILSNHVHLVLANKPDLARSWDEREVARRWLTLHPARWLRKRRGLPPDGPPSDEEIDELVSDSPRIAVLRRRMHDLGWFMKCLKEPIARRANREDNVTGHFWEGRYHAFRIADIPAVVATSAYVDLNEVRAGTAAAPEAAAFSSASIRAAQAARRTRRQRCVRRRARLLRTQPSQAATLLAIPLTPLPGMSDLEYLEFLERSARQPLRCERGLGQHLPPILERLGIARPVWSSVVRKGIGRIRGSIAGTADSVRHEARRRGRRWLRNAIDPLLGSARSSAAGS
jgi:hypothetical protein